MKIERNTRPTSKGSFEWFTGDVYLDPIAIEGFGVSSAAVHFAPGARTAWHTHDLGQTLYIAEGVARVQREGGPVEEVRTGDVVFFEPGENHWHGATPDRFMMHIVLVPLPETGSGTNWGEKVTDDEYNG